MRTCGECLNYAFAHELGADACPVGDTATPPSSASACKAFARRYRLAVPGNRLKGCPLRHEADQDGQMRQVACTDLKGTLPSCSRCQR